MEQPDWPACIRHDPGVRRADAALGINQGLYNGFLAAGLIWSLVAGANTGFAAKVFFLVCVAVAGIFGAVTVSPRILFVQTVPAATALVFVVVAY